MKFLYLYFVFLFVNVVEGPTITAGHCGILAMVAGGGVAPRVEGTLIET